VWRSAAVLLWHAPGMMFRTDLRVDGLLWGCLAAFALRRIRIPGWVFALSVPAAVAIGGWYRYGGGLIFLPAALAAAVTVTAQRPGWAVSAALDWKPLAWIGRMSYSIYLWQQIFLTPAWTHPRLPIDWPIPIRLAAVMLAATASYYFVEKPCIQMGRRLAAMPSGGVLQMAAKRV
jgi:peptidoglycan/LPS O-acetylase OafA/YrhL